VEAKGKAYRYPVRIVLSCTPATFTSPAKFTLSPHKLVVNIIAELAIVIGFLPASTPSSTALEPAREQARCRETERVRWLQIQEMRLSRSVEAAP
jgi:hypothetical protein